MHGVPILMYHRLFADPGELDGWAKSITRHWVSVVDFQAQVRALADEGYRAVPLSAVVDGLPSAGPGKSVVITFDDGWQSDHRHARPILDRLGWSSEHFVTVGWVGADDFVSWRELGEIAAQGAGVHSHTLTHPDLDRLSASDVHRELDISKRRLEERLGRPVRFLALPGGTGATASVTTSARTLGYRAICTSRVGLNPPDGDPYALRRIPVTRHTPLATLLNWVGGGALDRLALTSRTLSLTRSLVPRPVYAYLRDLVLR